MSPLPSVNDVISNAFLGFWAFLGLIMRGTSDWIDQATGKFSLGRFATAIATCLVMGQVASVIGQAAGWGTGWVIVAASTLAYLGPAIVMPLVQKKFFGGTLDGTTKPADKG